MEHQVNSLWSQLNAWLPTVLGYTGQVILALIVLLVGWKIINMVIRAMGRMMAASHIEPTLQGFLLSVAGLLMKALLLISVASMVGIATTSFVAVLGAAGLAVGILPRIAAEPHARSMPIRLIPLTDEWARRWLLLGVRDADTLTVAARLLLAHLRGER